MFKNFAAAEFICFADDVATGSIVDSKIGFRTHKTGGPIIVPTKKQQQQLVDHFGRYIALMTSTRLGVDKCDRYARDGDYGARIMCKDSIKAGKTIEELTGVLATVNEEFLNGINDFSVVQTTFRNKTRLWLGPASYANHDCEANSRIIFIGNDMACIRAVRNIDPGEEITINYGPNYFGKDNAECQCLSCEIKGTGAFSRAQSTQHEGLLICAYCNSKFRFKSWLKRHVTKHMKNKVYRCSQCWKTFSRSDNRDQHQRRHTENKLHGCQICGANFVNLSNLRYHKRQKHSEQKEVHQCPQCPAQYKNRHDLMYHDNRVHTHKNPFKCPACECVFPRPQDLYKHRKQRHD